MSTPQGPIPAIGIPDSQDYPRLVFSAPYFETVPLAELIAPAVTESVEAQLPGLVPPYVDAAAQAAVNQLAVLLAGSTMQGPLYLNPVMPTQPSQAASMAYVDSMIATAGIPEVPPTPIGQVWARMTGQWTPVSEEGGTFLPIGGGTMQGPINMSGNAITNLPALPVMPNGAAPAQWVLNQISSVSLYQGTWNLDTYTPDLTQLSTHVNGYTWIAITTSPSGVVIGPPIPGLQGQTVFNGDTVIYSATAGAFQSIHSGGLTLPEAQALFLPLAGGQMSGALLLNANATQPTQAVTLQQVQGITAGFISPEAPTDGQLYGRNGLTHGWGAVLPLGGGTMVGQLLLNANATNALQAVPYQQLVSYTAGNYLPTAGGTMVGPLVLSGNASAPLNPVTLTQLNSMLGSYLPLAGGTLSGQLIMGIGNSVSLMSGQLSFNATLSGGNWIYSTAGIAATFALNGSPPTELDLWIAPTGSAGATASFTQLARFMPAGVNSQVIFIGNLATAGGFNQSWNATSNAGGWQYLNDGPAATAAPLAQGWTLSVAPSGTANSTITFTQPLIVSPGGVTVQGGMTCTGTFTMAAGAGINLSAAGIYLPSPASIWGVVTGSNWPMMNMDSTGDVVLAPGAIPGNVMVGNGYFMPNANGIILPNATSLWWRQYNSSVLMTGMYVDGNNSINIGGGTNLPVNVYVNTVPGSSGGGFVLNEAIPWANQPNWNVNSDPRIKTNQNDYTNGVSLIAQLEPITFSYNGLANTPNDAAADPPVVRYGFDAAVIKTIMPELITSRMAKLNPDDTMETEILAIGDMSPLIMTLINAVKQLIARVGVLEAAAAITPPAADTA